MKINLNKLKCWLGWHDWTRWSSVMCGNVAYIRLLEDWQKYSFRKCYKCDKEMPHSRFFHNIGVREKNAKTTMEPVVDKVE